MRNEKEGFCTIRESAPLSFDAGELPVSVGGNAFHGDLGCPADCGEGGPEEDRIIVDANAIRLMSK